MNENKTAIQFRDSNLMNIIGLAFNMLSDTFQADDSTVGSPELRIKLFQYSLQLLPVMLLPEDWLTTIITTNHISLLFSMYFHDEVLT